MKTWSTKDVLRLIKDYPTCQDPRELATRMGKTYVALKTKAAKLGLKRLLSANIGRTKLTPAQDRYLKAHYLEQPPQRLADRFGVSEVCIKGRIRQLGLIVPREVIEQRIIASRIQKGNTPMNKGRKMKEWMSAEGIRNSRRTRFKKGSLSHNTQYDGAIRVRRDSSGRQYQYIRVSLGKWELLHRWVWTVMKGEIPSKHLVVFKDGNPGNCNIDNLEVITRAENMRRNTYHNYPKDIALMVQLRGALNRQINKHLKTLKSYEK
jgi:hypothetical protein